MIITKDIENMATLIAHLRGKENPVRLEDVSVEKHISLHFLEQLARKLRLVGIVVSTRGPGGGYMLASDRLVDLTELYYVKYRKRALSTMEQVVLTKLKGITV